MSDLDLLEEASSLSGDGGDDDGSPPVAGPRLAAEVAAPVSDSDVDFLAEASSDEEPALAAPVVPAADAADAVPARRRRARRADRDVAEPRVSIYGMPSERTELQHALLTAKMREKKAQTAYRKACSAQAADLVNQFNDLIASSGVPSRTALSLQVPRWMSGKSHTRKHIGNLKIIATTHRRMAPISKLAMAYSGVHCIKSLATMFQCDASTIEYNQRLVAVAFLDLQAMLVERVVEAIQTAQLTFAIVTTRSDETGERLAYTGILGTESHQTPSVWQVLISRLVFIFGSAMGSYTFECVCAPIPVLNTDAESLWYALEHHPSVQHVQTMKKALLRVADIAVDINEFDAASSNLRFHAHKMDTCEEHILAEQMLCHNHQNKLVEILMLKAIGYNLLMSLYSISLFLKMGGYFVRLVGAVREVVHSEACVILPGPPPEEEQAAAAAFAEEFTDMLLQNYTPSDSKRARRYRRPRPGDRDRVAEDMLDSDSEPAAPQETDGPAAGGDHRRWRRDRKARRAGF